ncbi:hypothetical protein F7D01_13705 [Erythrobacter sp. 3-20A1M]|uniref:hypothetical protein n=1 Tax=Erythrobacter sp. 3-20A1M TaxID=2653850 RepID=UPI001BFC2BBA|nr:hypothetical protein [Erythrobacter sp. 3-20A1M]QWC57977.1 hypothetical protein F7D01_13705 [Erythrobacter sp. 3-20A1M]
MARKKPVTVNPNIAWSASNPHSWLILRADAPGAEAVPGWRVMHGNLRARHRDHDNSLTAFAQAKLRPDGTPGWIPTAHRVEVLLPAHADDALCDPETLIVRAEAELPNDPKGLATYVTLTCAPDRLHAQFEVARQVARDLVDRFEVAVLIVQHVPAKAANANAPHCHLVIPGPRRLTAWSGFGSYVTQLSSDAGRDVVVDTLLNALAV